jgi:8-oxo-dGTP diphosphatase
MNELTTLCLVTKDNDRQVLLAEKAQGFGAGVLNAFGGKPKDVDGGSIEQTLVREVAEEVGLVLDPRDLEKVAVVRFSFDGEFKWEMHTFVARRWVGQPCSTKEMRNPAWYDTLHLPWGRMWEGDPHWMIPVFSGEKVKLDIFYRIGADEAKTVEKVLRHEVDF